MALYHVVNFLLWGKTYEPSMSSYLNRVRGVNHQKELLESFFSKSILSHGGGVEYFSLNLSEEVLTDILKSAIIKHYWDKYNTYYGGSNSPGIMSVEECESLTIYHFNNSPHKESMSILAEFIEDTVFQEVYPYIKESYDKKVKLFPRILKLGLPLNLGDIIPPYNIVENNLYDHN